MLVAEELRGSRGYKQTFWALRISSAALIDRVRDDLLVTGEAAQSKALINASVCVNLAYGPRDELEKLVQASEDLSAGNRELWTRLGGGIPLVCLSQQTAPVWYSQTCSRIRTQLPVGMFTFMNFALKFQCIKCLHKNTCLT